MNDDPTAGAPQGAGTPTRSTTRSASTSPATPRPPIPDPTPVGVGRRRARSRRARALAGSRDATVARPRCRLRERRRPGGSPRPMGRATGTGQHAAPGPPHRPPRRSRPPVAAAARALGTIVTGLAPVRGPRVGRHRVRPRPGRRLRPARRPPSTARERPADRCAAAGDHRRVVGGHRAPPPRSARPSSRSTTVGASGDPFGGRDPEGVGSGVIYDAEGWILTNRHVVADADKLTGRAQGRPPVRRAASTASTPSPTSRSSRSTRPDLPGRRRSAHSDGLKVGQLVVAIGSPLGTYSFSVTSGIVSGKGRDDHRRRAASGSRTSSRPTRRSTPATPAARWSTPPGRVVGINTAVATDSSGIGFAIPIDIARPIMDQAVAGEDLTRPWIGIRFLSIDQQVQQERNLSVDSGALVATVGGYRPRGRPGQPGRQGGPPGRRRHPVDQRDDQSTRSTRSTRCSSSSRRTTPCSSSSSVTASRSTIDVTLGTRPGNL